MADENHSARRESLCQGPGGGRHGVHRFSGVIGSACLAALAIGVVAGVVRVPGTQEPGGDDVVHGRMRTQPRAHWVWHGWCVEALDQRLGERVLIAWRGIE